MSCQLHVLHMQLGLCRCDSTFGDEGKNANPFFPEVGRMELQVSVLGTIRPFDRGLAEWSAYCERALLYLRTNAVNNADRQHAVFLSVCGAQTYMYQLICSLVVPAKPMAIVKDHLQPAPSEIMQHFNFNGRVQKGEETVTEYVAELRRIAEHCEFKDVLNEMVRDFLVCGIKNTRAQRWLLVEPKRTFAKTLEIAQAAELAEKGAHMLQPHQVMADTVPHVVQPALRSCYRCWEKHSSVDCRYKDWICWVGTDCQL